MSSRSGEGSFPASGPLVYLTEDPVHARALLAGPRPAISRWFHATCREGAIQAVHHGLVPSCWRGGDTCAVFGVDALHDVHSHHGECVLEIRSRALPGALKAWWVPPECILGVWQAGSFTASQSLRARPAGPPPAVSRCACELAALIAEQIAKWSTPPRTGTRAPHRR